MSNSIKNIIEKSAKKSFLNFFVKDYLIPPDKFKEWAKDNRVKGEEERPDFCKNLDDYLLSIKKDLVNSELQYFFN